MARIVISSRYCVHARRRSASAMQSRQACIDWAWDAFDFDEDDWDDGFGYDDVCNNTKPLSRAMSGVFCLTYSSPRFPNESYNGNILEWGCRFARNAIDELDGRCGNSSCTPTRCSW